MKDFPAHIREGKQSGKKEAEIQTVQAHCRGTARYASDCLRSVNLSNAAYLAGLVHDCGKFTDQFSEYIWKAFREEPVRKGAVNHTFAGVRLLLERFHGPSCTEYGDMTAELLAYAVGAHHGQFDCINEKGESGFLHRLEAENIGSETARENFLRQCASWPELEELFRKANGELLPIYERLSQQEEQQMFGLSQLARLLLSAVIEGDRRDTAEFMDGIQTPGVKIDETFWKKHLEQMESRLSGFSRDRPIQAARCQISDQCRRAAERPAGVYRLNVPTGGGKTLSALRFALAHAEKWEKKRIIFVTPLLTILEQNAAVIRNFIGDDSIILEHHSNVLPAEENPEALDLRELAANSWDAPVIITTLVQLLNTMFLGKTTAIRRYQALCDAVVVIDEVQTVPNFMLSLFNTAVNFLAENCKTTFLLCSATQPCFDAVEPRLIFSDNADIVPYQPQLWEPFRRTVIQDAGALRLEQIPDFVRTVLQDTKSLLLICNKKSEAEFLYRQTEAEDLDCFHLSSSMCMAHRRKVLAAIEEKLAGNRTTGRKTVCISTQVMEAGVDISFGCVIRLTAGMDSVIQSAGRCNRNGEESQPAPVYLLECAGENLSRLREIREGKQATLALLDQFQHHPRQLGGDLASEQAISWYYHYLFDRQMEIKGYQQFTVESGETLFDLLSWNDGYVNADDPVSERFALRQAFKTAGELFRVMDDSSEDVFVPYGDGAHLLRELEQMPRTVAPAALKAWSRKAKAYTISLYQYQKKALAASLRSVRNVLVLEPECYSNETGLLLKQESKFLEV